MRKITLLFCFLLAATAWAQPGAIDTSFNTGNSGPDLVTYTSVNQPDGKILIAGAFDNYNGTTRAGIARINPDGTLDPTFDPGAGIAISTEYIYSMALQADGKVLIGGTFTSFNGVARTNLARLNADGSVDTDFNPGTGPNNEVTTISVQSTGKIIIGGLYTQYNGTSGRLFRLHADGTIDTSFNAGGVGPNFYVWTSSVLPDDKIYIGGGFSMFNGTNANHLIRLNADGTRDATFTNVRYTNNAVLAHAVQPDGKIVIGGYFTNYGGVGFPRNRLARINANGTLDATFTVGSGLNDYPLTLVCQPNGKILAGGAFTTYNGATVNRFFRLNTDGSHDLTFDSGTGMNGIVYKANFQPDGKFLVASEATNYNDNTTQPNFSKINAYAPNSIAITALGAEGPYCPGAAFDVDLTAEGYYTDSNVFTVQLSDASGSFDDPSAIATLNGAIAESIPVTLPLVITPGSGYRLRVVASDLETIGTDNGADLTIQGEHLFYADADGDGYGVGAQVSLCAESAEEAPEGFAVLDGDCNDDDATVHPNATEIPYNAIDDDCDGTTDETGTVTTTLLPAFCGATLASINTLVGIQTVGGHAITGYRIRLTKDAEVQTIERNVPHFTIPQFPSHDYASTYTVEIQLQRAGIWQVGWGSPCLVSTPAILSEGGAAAVNPSQCGITLARINTLIATTSLQGVTGYRFRVSDLTNPSGANAVQTIDRVQNWFSLQMLARYHYGTTYRIEVAVKTTGDFGLFGAPCELSSPAVPSINNCGGTVSGLGSLVSTTSMSGVTQYRFLVVREADNASATIDRNTPYFTFAAVPSEIFTPAGSYTISVALLTTGTWSPMGSGCSITAPGALAKGIASTAEADTAIRITASPNPFTEHFVLDVVSDTPQTTEIKVYDMLGRLLESATQRDAHFELGRSYPTGVYNVVVKQADAIRTLRVVKR
ncbi:MopE-related protein [Flavobacterium caeni]|uniref:Delta-60 repeat domain-containing protein/Por secretion system C-terminal sorting domain-containing protein n=1 Tax=Flavobacterium caeni TaxID=490189 RepID=A0A1G5EFE3_9FLAO|nr:MopE-related protein [Flavobacterium caeni]SCY25676.1 delta-60 repeat domain-containing protein/Por secretion system C-terminal sorting domain-containing protein [Flavobacterium caeni]